MKTFTVVVLYRPDSDVFDFLKSYACDQNPTVAVWNDCRGHEAERLSGVDGVILHALPANAGLASALNIGIEDAFLRGADAVLLLDQDSRPSAGMAMELSAALEAAKRSGIPVALAGPTLSDMKAGGVVNLTDMTATNYQLANKLATSGSLIEKSAYQAVGPMWEDLFIDCIDHEWCYRAQSKGLSIIQATTVNMEHDMGDAGINFLGRYKPIHRSPIRHYYITRNTLWLARLSHLPKSFSLIEIVKLVYRIPVYLIVSSSKRATLVGIFRAIVHGLFCPISSPIQKR